MSPPRNYEGLPISTKKVTMPRAKFNRINERKVSLGKLDTPGARGSLVENVDPGTALYKPQDLSITINNSINSKKI